MHTCILLFLFPLGSCQFPTLGFVVERVCGWYLSLYCDDSVVCSKTEDLKQKWLDHFLVCASNTHYVPWTVHVNAIITYCSTSFC